MQKVFHTISVTLAVLLLPQILSAATLSFSPSLKTVNAGDTFSVNVVVDSSDQEMNAASGVVTFPTDILEAKSVSKLGSIISLWVKEPTFSNSEGIVTFEGILLGPGYKGAQGKILTIAFKAKKTGQASIAYTNASILANDGSGTNILYAVKPATLSLVPAPEKPSAPKAEQPLEQKLANTFSISTTTNTDPPQVITVNFPAPIPTASPAETPTPLRFTDSVVLNWSLYTLAPFLIGAVVLLNLYILSRFLLVSHRLHTEKKSEDASTALKRRIHKHVLDIKEARHKRSLTKEELTILEDFDV